MMLDFASLHVHLPSLDLTAGQGAPPAGGCHVSDTIGTWNQTNQDIYPYNAHSTGAQGLNQTPGWGCESGDQYGDGMSYDSGVGTNQPSSELHPYDAVAKHTQGLNQTYGWGCESGDQYGDGMSYDSGVGTNQSDTQIDPYSAVAKHTQGLNQTYGWGCESGDQYGSGTSYDSGVGTNQSDTQIDPYSAVASNTSAVAKAAAPAPLAPLPEESEAVQSSSDSCRPSPGHFILAAHACTFGLLAAAVDLGSKVIGGEKDSFEGFGGRFQEESIAAANVATPLGGYVLSKHVFGQYR